MKMYGRRHNTDTFVELGFDEIVFGNQFQHKNNIVASIRNNQVDVRTEHGRIIIIPQAANCIYVEPEDKN